MSGIIKSVLLILLLHVLHDTGLCSESFKDRMDPTTDFNKAHLKEDLDGIIDKSPEEMDANELQFHYFRQHDYDGDDSLDGNEIIMSIVHQSKELTDSGEPIPKQTDEQLMTIVDDILEFQDKDKDGKISFQEYIVPYQPDTDEVL